MAVYVIGPEGGPYKIGKAVNVKRRVGILQGGNWIHLELITTFDGGYDLEQYLHGVFSNKRGLGEWFYLSTEDLLDLPKIVKEYKPIPGVEGEYVGLDVCGCGQAKNRKSKRCKYCYAGNPDLWGKRNDETRYADSSDKYNRLVLEFKNQIFDENIEGKVVGADFVSELNTVKQCDFDSRVVYHILREKGYVVKPGTKNRTMIYGLARKRLG